MRRFPCWRQEPLRKKRKKAAPSSACPSDEESLPQSESSDVAAVADWTGMRDVSLADRFSYRLDTQLAKRWVQWVLLAAVGMLEVVGGGLLYTGAASVNGDRCSDVFSQAIGLSRRPSREMFAEGFWEAWTFMADPGTCSKTFLPEQRVVSSVMTILGFLFFGIVIAVVVDVTREKMEGLRQGKSKVVEAGHTVVLGWTDKTIPMIIELCISMESEGGGVVVVLSSIPRPRMIAELAHQLPLKDRKGTTIICRNRSPLLISDLLWVSSATAKAVVILASTGDPDKADAESLRTMLSLCSLGYPVQGHIVAEVRDIDNEPLLRLLAGSSCETLVTHDVLGRLMLMSARQPGLARVYESLLGFEGHEFYMREWPELVGLRFGDLMDRFPDAIPIGLGFANGSTLLKPPNDRRVKAGESIIVLAEDDDTYRPEAPEEIEIGDLPSPREERKKKEKILFCGWRRDIRDILLCLDQLVVPGTEVHTMTHLIPIEKRNAVLLDEGLDVSTLERIRLVHHKGNTSVRRKLEQLELSSYNSCMIFADQAFESDSMHADSHSLATLLLIRDLQAYWRGEEAAQLAKTLPLERRQSVLDSRSDRQSTRSTSTPDDADQWPPQSTSSSNLALQEAESCPIVCEILDCRTVKTITENKHVSLASEFCQTNKLIAQLMAMVAENRSVKQLLDELLGATGCKISVRPSSRYVRPGEEVSFNVLAKRALHFSELALGYQLRHSLAGTELNPTKKSQPRNGWEAYDIAILEGLGQLRQSSVQPGDGFHSDASNVEERMASGGVGPRSAGTSAEPRGQAALGFLSWLRR